MRKRRTGGGNRHVVDAFSGRIRSRARAHADARQRAQKTAAAQKAPIRRSRHAGPSFARMSAVAETAYVAYVALGSNLNNPQRMVHAGFEALARLPDTQVLTRSSLYRSAPVGYADQPDFINAVAALRTALNPRVLLDALLAIEHVQGRVREFPNAPRTLDLDLLLYGERVIHEPGLSVPHPRMHQRAFVLLPLAEIASGVIVPGVGRVSELLASIDVSGVTRIE